MAAWLDKGDLTPKQALDIPPVWLLGFLVLAYAIGRVLPIMAQSYGPAKALGALLIVAGVGLMVWALAVFRAHATSVVPHQMPKRMITTGPFAISRNPIYLGDAMVLAGASLWWGHGFALGLIPVFCAVIQRRFIAPEEGRLKESFGDDFQEYAQKTRRWA